MNVFIQGMRRSGTTILFDILWEDERFDCYYEPFAECGKEAWGGGSGVRHTVDYLEKIRSCRTEFVSMRLEQTQGADRLNYGAPGRPELEFEPELPEYCRAYLRFLLSRSADTVVKFTRMYCKVAELWKIDPDAKFIHVTRDPRLVAVSYLFGKNQKFKDRYSTADEFFGRISKMSRWSSRPFSDWISNIPEYRSLKGCEDFLRILLIWKYVFQKTYKNGRAFFGKNYMLFRHEALCNDPVAAVKLLYDFLGRPFSRKSIDWAAFHVSKPRSPFFSGDERWHDAFKKLDMAEVLSTAGYAHCPTR